jgi:hypothetical protein
MHMTWMAKARNRPKKPAKTGQKREKRRKNAKSAPGSWPRRSVCSEKTARALAPGPVAHKKSPKIHHQNAPQKVIHNRRLM